MHYSIVDTEIWTDPDMVKKSIHARYLFQYLITSPHSHPCGLYRLRIPIVVLDIGLNQKQVASAFQEISDKATYDSDNSVVWVHAMMKRQLKNANIKQKANVADHLQKLGKTPLIEVFLNVYTEWEIPYTMPTDTRTIGIPTNLPKPNQNKTTLIPAIPYSGNDYSERFEKFWSVYPKKVGKGAAWNSWKSKRLEAISDIIIKSVNTHKETQDWKKNGGQYIPNPATFLNQSRWEDDIDDNPSDSIDKEMWDIYGKPKNTK